MGHYEERLEQDLASIQANIRDISTKVETALADATSGLLEGDKHLANMTVLRDNRINRISRRIDRQCHAFIAKHLPGAGHLRWISSVIRLNVALERVGDYAVTISREGLQLQRPPAGQLPQDLSRLAEESRSLLRAAVDAFLDRSADGAAATIPVAQEIEDSMDDIYARLIDSAEGRSPREVVAVFVAFSLLKRISDQAKNISEQTLFAVAGERKKTRPFNILFVGSGDNEHGLIARGIAGKSFAGAGVYQCAAPEPPDSPPAATMAFLEACGIPTEDLEIQKLDTEQKQLQSYDIIICLDDDASRSINQLPFHTTVLTWNVGEALADAAPTGDEERRQAAYRFLTERLSDLMDLIADRRSGN